ncbi:hypothetical protein LMANV2_230015 [Leptospira interrogans serovar Manilae]|uniref:Uncharacterized protein n=1 Tax=Leptospira interrogans serovar Manilae TaxID=214675 RepID=A0AAQ1NWX1_LEPIR|nr:hypothetical protein LMANV2_230015 [Leptospira interrogans serovar Manilae]
MLSFWKALSCLIKFTVYHLIIVKYDSFFIIHIRNHSESILIRIGTIIK